MINEATIAKAVEFLQKAAPEGQVMLFGSYARGDANEKSDLDLLVVKPQLESRRVETIRLKRVLRPLGIPADIIVIDQKTYDLWSQVHKAITKLSAQPNRSYPTINFKRRIWSIFGSRPPGAP